MNLFRDRELVGSNPIAPIFKFNELAGDEKSPVFFM